MKILIVTGSISERSMNKRVARFIEKSFEKNHEIHHFDLKAIPFYNQDIESNPPQVIHDMRETFADTDAVIVVTPEYNHSIPGVLKNMLDWGSRGKRILKSKPVLMVSSSQGQFAGIRSQIHLKQVMASPGVEAKVYQDQIMIPFVQDKFEQDGSAIDQNTADFILATIEAFTQSVNS